MTIHVCTIIARNYLPAARVLATSFRDHHPDGRITTLVIDDLHHETDGRTEPFEVRHLDELLIDSEELFRMAMIYDVMEFATAVKPWLLELLSSEGSPTVLYLDPDIRVYAPLTELAELASQHGLVLTPHAVHPMPRDDRSITETDILLAGIYNLGFVGVRADSTDFLRFWKERLARECYVDPIAMRFVDQRWIDFVPGMFNVHIVRDPSYNVAYWNLDHRKLDLVDGVYTINGDPLRFFHFSGFDAKKPHLLSKHQGERPRILLSDNPALATICREYTTALATTGQAEESPDYALGYLPNGVPIDKHMRFLYRDWINETERLHEPLPPSPFTVDGEEAFLARLNSPAPTAGGVRPLSRYLARAHEARADLRANMSDPAGTDNQKFWTWVAAARKSGELDPRLAVADGRPDQSPPVRSETKIWARPDRLRPGICVAGYMRAEAGVGQQGRLAAETVRRAGIELSTFVCEATPSRQQHPFQGPFVGDLNVNLVVVNADMLPSFAADVGPSFFDGRYTIGLWAWELEEFPTQFAGAFAYLDEVWGDSDFTCDAIAALSDKPAYAFPLPIVAPQVPEGVGRNALGLPEGPMFLFCFDMFSVFERKNPLATIRAFSDAFAPGEGPILVIKVINGESKLPDLERLKAAAAERPDVYIWDRYLDSETNAAIMATCDCYVSLHRSEGFGLTMAEAMALGKPVIATAYSGNLDFMDAESAYLVPWSYSTVPDGYPPYRPGAKWAEPHIDIASQLMRRVVDHPEEAASVGMRGRQLVERDHGLTERADFIKGRFDHAQRVLAERGRPTDRARDSVLATVRERLVRVGRLPARQQPATTPTMTRTADLQALALSRAPLNSPSSFPELVRPVRRILSRILAHQDDHRRTVDAALAANATMQAAKIDRLESHLRRLDNGILRQAGLVSSQAREIAQRVGTADKEKRERAELASAMHETALAASQEREKVRKLDAELHATPYMSDPSVLLTTDDHGLPAIGYNNAHPTEAQGAYVEFEEIFRGPEDFIRHRQLPYLRLLTEHAPVVDLGCGRGELLDLLRDANVKAWGVDLDTKVARLCEDKGHDVVISDALTYLRAESDESIGAIFSAQLLEHLSADDSAEMIRQAYRVLRPDGLLIVETVNPHSVAAFKTFWTDLTHRVPIFPEVATLLCRQAGFPRALVIFPNGSGVLEEDRRTQGEYAVIAWKSSARAPGA